MNELIENDKTHWQWYKSLFNVTILRYLVTWFAIVPVLAKLFSSLNPHIKFKNILDISFATNPSLSFTLWVLWLASLFYVIALLIYQFLCPPFIQTYSSFGDYKYYRHSPRWIIWEVMKVLNDKDEIGKLFTRLETKKYLQKTQKEFSENYVNVEGQQSVAYFKHDGKSYSLALPILKDNKVDIEETDLAEQEIFWEIFGRFSTSKKYWRLAIIILLFISLLLFLYTLVEHILTGLNYFFFK